MRTSLLIARADGDLGDFLQPLADDYGYRVETVRGGVQCIDSMRASRPDVLILERDLPWGGAEGVLTRMRDEHDIPMVPVVIVCDGPQKSSAAFKDLPVVFVIQELHTLAALVDCIEAAASLAEGIGRRNRDVLPMRPAV